VLLDDIEDVDASVWTLSTLGGAAGFLRIGGADGIG
jgi:hypothetical protein